ncbi:putative DNA binding domain-containing protein [Desulfobacterales bacterium HSG16]|nr:putative DNA binding domain-containing protein [Desulfobacterales bacterium HSG16]
MAKIDSTEYLSGLLNELCQLPKETEWVEFKCNNSNPETIGEYISALSNSAALEDKTNAYIVWGINDETHDIEGTDFRPTRAKKGNEELENWLIRLLSPRINIKFIEFEINEKRISMIEIPRTAHQPVRFQSIAYIRVGSYKKKLKDFPEKERELWRIFDVTPFEQQIAIECVSSQDVLTLLDYQNFFNMLDMPLPEKKDYILNRLKDEHMIQKRKGRKWDILNLGAILFANDLSDFRPLDRKAVRVVIYDGDGRIQTIREYQEKKGYAAGFKDLIGYIQTILPLNEVIESALRKNVSMYPEIAIRELVANVIIHQDFTISGTGPMIEIFDRRLEITNPGKPLVDTQRFLDSPPRSRNEDMASFLRRIGICEERGSGVDKVVFQTEFYQLPAPLFEVSGEHTRAVLFAQKPFAEMDKTERTRACYLHACLQNVQRKTMTNATLRERFGIEKKNSSQVSRIISDAVDAGLIKLYNPESGSKRLASYIPFWA